MSRNIRTKVGWSDGRLYGWSISWIVCFNFLKVTLSSKLVIRTYNTREVIQHSRSKNSFNYVCMFASHMYREKKQQGFPHFIIHTQMYFIYV